MALLEERRGLAVKIVYKYPRPATTRPQRGDLVVRTHRQSLLVARTPGSTRNEWWYNGDHLRNWKAAEQRRRQRLLEDRKHGQGRRRAIGEQLEQLAGKRARRERTARQQIAADLAGKARRLGVARVVWDDSERGYLPHWNYSELALLCRQRLEQEGIALVTVAELDKQKRTRAEAEAWLALQQTLAALADENEPAAADEAAAQTA
jgi:hypothetical protein